MRFHRLIGVLLAGLAVAGCTKTAPVAPVSTSPAPEIDPVYGHLLHAQSKLPTIKLWLGDQELISEVATRQVEIATGMMFRTNMAENEGMLFVFPNATDRSFYMRNCVVPLSGAYMSPSGEILQIINMKPHDETGIPSASSNIQFVLEVPQGWFERHHISTGAVLRTERGPLLDTFFGKQ
jgi:uncharacterized membrane protein (UPF0127 family)